MSDEEVAQQQSGDDQRDAGVAQQERPVLRWQLRDADGAECRAEPQRALRDHHGVQQYQREHGGGALRHGERGEPASRIAEQRCIREPEPLEKHRDPRELREKRCVGPRKRERDRDELRDEDDREHHARLAEVGNVKGVEPRIEGRCRRRIGRGARARRRYQRRARRASFGRSINRTSLGHPPLPWHGLRRPPRRRGTHGRRRRWCGTAGATACSGPAARARSRSSSAAARGARRTKDPRAALEPPAPAEVARQQPRPRVARSRPPRAGSARRGGEHELRVRALRPIAVAHGAVGRRRPVDVGCIGRRAEQRQQEGAKPKSKTHDRGPRRIRSRESNKPRSGSL